MSDLDVRQGRSGTVAGVSAARRASDADEDACCDPVGTTGPVAPVSYTHLRAHETVLDLVCRLLLTKKKKKITPHITTDNI